MKRWIPMMLCLVLLLGMVCWGVVQPVSAAGTAHMSIYSSASTVYRGDSFTLTVNLSNDQPVSNGAIYLLYDSSAFEFLGGSCNVSNVTLQEVSAAVGGGVFALQTDAVVSGTIFTINMRVKESAPLGSHTISGEPSLNIACGLSGTSVTVACRHSFGSSTKVNDQNHESTCTICGEKKSEAHTWNSGTVTKEATCKATGVKKLTCTGCGATKDETIPVSNAHKFGSWSNAGDSGHSHTCSVCGKKETSSHTWNSGTVQKKATCQETGTKKLTCTGCGAEKTASIPKTDHAYTSAVVDDANHKRTCQDCGKEVTEAHQYGETWAHDENWHYRVCTVCEHKNEQAAHQPGPKATETTDQICTVCNRILQPKGEHVHSFSQEWSTDETGHWHACSDCNEKDSAGLHEFDDDCDADCNVCGMIREPLHAPEENWSADESGHWYLCTSCEERVGFAAHTAGPAATITTPQLCTVCQFEIAPILPHDHVFDENGTLHQHQCACGETYEAEMKQCQICKPFPWWIVCIAEAVVFCGVGAFFWLKKGKKQQEA